MRSSRRAARGIAVALGLAAAIVVVPAGVASAHEEKVIGPYHLAVGFGDEPAYAGQENSVQMFLHVAKTDKPVVDLGPTLQVEVIYQGKAMPKMTLEPDFEVGESGIPGDYRAFFFPTEPGTYTFHLTGAIKGTKIDQSFTSGPKTFSDVEDPTQAEFPTKLPTGTELAGAITRLQGRADIAVTNATHLAQENVRLRHDVDSGKRLALIALLVGGVLGLAGLATGIAGVRAGRGVRSDPGARVAERTEA
jgi:hypothetical protein